MASNTPPKKIEVVEKLEPKTESIFNNINAHNLTLWETLVRHPNLKL
jgi:hypothetical protein